MAYMKHIVLYHWSLCACIVIGCVIRVYIGSCVATRESGYLILYFVRTYVTHLHVHTYRCTDRHTHIENTHIYKCTNVCCLTHFTHT